MIPFLVSIQANKNPEFCRLCNIKLAQVRIVLKMTLVITYQSMPFKAIPVSGSCLSQARKLKIKRPVYLNQATARCLASALPIPHPLALLPSGALVHIPPSFCSESHTSFAQYTAG